MSEFVFAVNFIASNPSKNGDLAVLLNPVGAAPSFTRRPGCTVTWKLWLPAAKAAEWTSLKAEADSKPNHKLFVTGEWLVSDGKSDDASKQVNTLKALTKVRKEVRPAVVVPDQSDLL